MSSVSVGSLQAEPSSVRPEMTIGKRNDMRRANRLSSLLYGVLIVTLIERSGRLCATRVFRGPIVESLTSFLTQLSFAHQPPQHFRRAKRLGTKFTMQILGDVQSHVEPDKIG